MSGSDNAPTPLVLSRDVKFAGRDVKFAVGTVAGSGGGAGAGGGGGSSTAARAVRRPAWGSQHAEQVLRHDHLTEPRAGLGARVAGHFWMTRSAGHTPHISGTCSPEHRR